MLPLLAVRLARFDKKGELGSLIAIGYMGSVVVGKGSGRFLRVFVRIGGSECVAAGSKAHR